MNRSAAHDDSTATDEIAVNKLLIALAAECRVAACDLDRVQQVFENVRRAAPAHLTPDQIVLMQEIDRLTQTVAAIGRSVELAHHTLPATEVGHGSLREAASLDSLFHRVVTGNSGSVTARHQDTNEQTTIF